MLLSGFIQFDTPRHSRRCTNQISDDYRIKSLSLNEYFAPTACNGTSAQSVEQNGNPLYFTSSSKDGWKLLVPESVTALKRMVYYVPENKVLLVSCPGSRKTHFQSDKPSLNEYNFAATCKKDKLDVERQNTVSKNLEF